MTSGRPDSAQDSAELRSFLEALGLARLAPVFARNDVDDAVFAELRDADLRELGLTLGQRKKFLVALDRRRAQPAPETGGELEARRLSVMFCDMVGSTELARRLGPDEIAEVLQAYYRTASRVTRAFGGFIATLQGDGIVVLFGYPHAMVASAERAVAAGLALLEAFEARDHRLAGGRSVPFRVRVGVATGKTIVGHGAGDDFAQSEIRMFGPVPNLAARLQTYAEAGSIVVDEATRAQAGAHFAFERLPDARLRGFDAETEVFRALGQRQAGGGAGRRDGAAPVAPVGRDREMAAVRASWEAARRGTPGLAVISGDPGLGKTLTLRALDAWAEADGARRLRLACSPLSDNAPLQPVIDCLEDLIGRAGDAAAGARLDALRNEMPDASELDLARVAAMLGAPQPAELPAESGAAAREALLVTLAGWLLGAPDRPTLIAVEDLHWIDATTRELLERVGAAAAGRALMLAATSRDGAEPIWAARPGRLAAPLGTLDGAASAELLGAILGGRGAPETIRRMILARGGGNPLMIEDLARSAEAWSDADLALDVQVPASIYDSVAERLDRLRVGRRVAAALAVCGGEANPRALSRMLDLPRRDLQAALDELSDTGMLERDQMADAPVVRFRHMLYRDVVYERLVATTRAALHEAAAQALVALDPDRAERQPEALAWHYLRAGDFRAAAPLALRAGERFAQRSALIEASHNLDQALAAIDELAEGPEADRMRLRALAAMAAVRRARFGIASDEVGALSARALEIARRLGDGPAELLALSGLYAHAVVHADYRAARGWAEGLVAAAEAAGDATFAMIGTRGVGVVALHLGRVEAAEGLLRDALDRYDLDRHLPLAHAHGYDHAEICAVFLSFTLWMRGDLAGARRVSDYAVRHSRIIEHAHSLAQALAFRSLLGILARDPDGLAAAGSEAVAIGERHDLKVMAAAGAFFRDAAGMLAADRPLDAAALAALLAARERFLKVNPYNYGPAAEVAVAEILLCAGDLDAAERHLALGDEVQERTGESWTMPELMRVRALVLAARGDAAGAEALRLEAHARAAEGGAATFALRIACDLAEACPSEAARRRLEAAAAAMRTFDGGWDERRLAALMSWAPSP